MGHTKSVPELIIWILFFALIILPAHALDDWVYYRQITVTNNAAQTLTDYQINFTLDAANLIAQGKMRSDCGDIRVTLSDRQTLLPYWIENLNRTSTCNTNTTRIWTKVSIPASGSTTILVWYGNPSATSAENASAVFLFFDHFNTSTGTLTFLGSCTWVRDTANSTIKVTGGSNDCVAVANVGTPNVRILTRAMIGVANSPFGLSARVQDINNRLYLYSRSDANHLSIAKMVGGSFSEVAYASFAESTNTWYIFEGLLYGTNLRATVYNDARQQIATVSATVSDFSTQTQHGLFSVSNAASSFDYLIIAQYISPEPSVSTGEEQKTFTLNDILPHLAAVLFIFLLLIGALIIHKNIFILISMLVIVIFVARLQITQFVDYMLAVFALIVFAILGFVFYERWRE